MKLPTGKNGIILLTALVALAVPVILLEHNVLQHTDGNITFPLDNAFLDISVGKNLAFYKVWGVSKYAFQSASTSLLYPVALAIVFFIFGAHLIIPIILNGVAAICFLYFLQQALIRRGLKPATQLAILLLVIFLAPLPLLVVSGMGFTLQLLFCFLCMEALATAVQEGGPNSAGPLPGVANPDRPAKLPPRVYIYGALAVAARYEDLVLVALACLLLVSLRRWTQALKLGAISLLPPIVFGIISLAKGSYFLPNSLLLGPYPGYVVFLATGAGVIGCLLIWQYRKLAAEKKPISIHRLGFTLLSILAIPFMARNIAALRHFEADSVRIYEQQYPMAAFVHRYYYRATVGVNDIGAVAYFSEGRKLDFTGTASGDVTKSKKEHSWSPLLADSLSRMDGIRAAIVSDPWFSPEQFPRWNKVASWKMPDSQSSMGKTLTFYVISQYDTAWLRKNLHEYEQLLPAGVAVRYY
jgi:hypothetical protein